MSDLFQRLVSLLGTPIDNADLQEFLKDCDEKPDFHETKFMQTYMFLKSGLYIMLDKRQDQIKSLFVHISTAAVESETIQPFAQNLPFGILSNDSRDIVKEKVSVKRESKKIQGRTPSDLKDFWDTYELYPLEYTFIFKGGDKRLSSLSVHYTVNPVPPRAPPLEPDEYIDSECSPGMREALKFAQEEARNLRHHSIGSEFLLLGLLGNDSSIASRALKNQGISKIDVRDGVTKIIGVGRVLIKTTIPFTPQAKVILEGARNVSKQLGSPNIRQEHCLLSIIDSEGVGIRTLNNLGVDLKRLEEDVHRSMKEEK